MQLVVKNDDKAQAMIKAMNDAGWVMYVNGVDTQYNTAQKFTLGFVTPGDKLEAVDVRFELPLSKGNNYQKGTNVNNQTQIGNLNL
jgi:hypothetical protein